MDPLIHSPNPDPHAANAAPGDCRPDALDKAMKTLSSTEQFTVALFGQGDRLRSLARQRRTTVAALIRHALRPILGDVSADTPESAEKVSEDDFSMTATTVRILRKHVRTLARRARASGMSRGNYLGELLDGSPPPELAKDHAALISALMLSTDRLAAMSVDISALMRQVGRDPASQLQSYGNGMQSLGTDVRAHLEIAATVLAELRRVRRPQ